MRLEGLILRSWNTMPRTVDDEDFRKVSNRSVSTYATWSAWLVKIELSCADLTGGQAPGSTTHRFGIAWLTLSISLRGHCSQLRAEFTASCLTLVTAQKGFLWIRHG